MNQTIVNILLGHFIERGKVELPSIAPVVADVLEEIGDHRASLAREKPNCLHAEIKRAISLYRTPPVAGMKFMVNNRIYQLADLPPGEPVTIESMRTGLVATANFQCHPIEDDGRNFLINLTVTGRTIVRRNIKGDTTSHWIIKCAVKWFDDFAPPTKGWIFCR